MSADPYKYFRVEAHELLEQLSQGALELEKGAASGDTAPRLLRLAHTLKGAARVVKLPEIAEMAHSVEDALTPLREAGSCAARNDVDRILQLLDAISERLAGLTPALEANEARLMAVSAVAEAPLRALRADVSDLDLLFNGLTEACVRIGSLRRALSPVRRLHQLGDLIAGQLRAPRARSQSRSSAISTLPMADELSSTAAAVEARINRELDSLERELRQVRDTSEHLRMLPAGDLFPLLERAARDAGRAVGKLIEFRAQGGDVRLDGEVLAAVQGALVQVVRNAVVHGVETEPERIAAGKQPSGRIVFEVLRQRNVVTFSCTDDGRGVDVEAVRRIARARGLLPAGAQTAGAAELIEVLLRGGVSTSPEVTEVAGRGIGLDLVRDAAARLGGEAHVRTEAARGTTVEIVVPISVASVDSLIVEASGVRAAIPLSAVRRSIRVGEHDLTQNAGAETVADGDTLLPFVRLGHVLGVAERREHQKRACTAVIVAGRTAAAAIGVDRLVTTVHTVSRPLPPLTPADAVVAGVALDAEGNPQLVLDPDGLITKATQSRPLVADCGARRAPILIVDDSLTTRMLEQSILTSAGYEVETAVSGEDGLEKARSRRYGLFLVDVEMPGIDGFTFVARTRTDPALRDTPAILVTSRSAAEDRQRGAAAGAVGYIVKGEFDQGKFLEMVHEIVG